MKRFFLLTLCLAALSACSDDDTAGPKPPVIGDVQFAAAIDPATAGSRVIQDGSTISWEAGDQIGITALIDGTPYIENIPYTLQAATSFSELSPSAQAILWNESVTGLRSYFAYYPFGQDNSGGELNRAVVCFSIPAEQHIVGGVNTTQPFLVGRASTSATQQQPVVLRFGNFSSVLELCFDPLEDTAVSTIEITPAEGSQLNGWMSGEGATDNLGKVTLDRRSDRLTVLCDGDGLLLDEPCSIRIPIGRFTAGTGGLTIRVVTKDERIFSETILAGEPFCSYVADDDGNFVSAKYIAHTMEMEVISDEILAEYFSDDFSWITSSERWNNLTGGGWPTVAAGTSPTGKANYFTLDLLGEFATIGYTTTADYRTSVQARYEGYVCLGISSKRAALTTPALEKVGAEPTDLLVSFYGANYATATMTPDTYPLVISVDGPGTIGDTDETTAEVTLANSFRWRKYWVIVKGATSDTRIVFGRDEALASARILIDNILIGKAVKGAVAGSRDVQVPVEPQIKLLGSDRVAINNLADAKASLLIQGTTSWSASCEADWLTVAPMSEGLGTGIAYNLTFHALTQNTSNEPRTATVVVASGDQASATIIVTQTNEIPEMVYLEDDFEWTKGDGTTGGILGGSLNSGTTIGTNGARFTTWTDAYKKYGWTSVGGYMYAKNGVLGFGTTTAVGDVLSPALTDIGATPTDIVVEYDVLEYKNASETGKSVFSVQGAGRIVSLEGNYSGVDGDSYTGIAADGKSCNYYCGNYAGWTNGAQWHHITVVVSGATSQTQVGVSGNGGYSRFWIDNFKVSPKK
ncbi:BACON domain-containing carbohydrate-binding protein [uncultured Alistipes sp.]|uniref:BACON domain-containing protein n=1 Tax=uncultured Alistipes sp. TaxID=538949 RepID=UPI0025E11EFB|nr:BACON domain-containing carbohydrate-binding protein [uncultured Alistipes sp.]